MKHPVSMKIRNAVRNTIEKHICDTKDKPLYLVALSGGADSLALASAAAFEANRKNAKFRIGAVIVDHGLQEVTKTVAADTAEIARNMGMETVNIISVDITNNGLGSEGDARLARYTAFEQEVSRTGASGVLIGHTMNDQAEQVLLGLARGSGVKSISGIAEKRDIYIRPMLSILRAETEESCHEMNLNYWVDPHNSFDEFTRVRVRNNIIPVLEEQLAENIVHNLAKTAQIAREESEVMEFFTAKTLKENLKTVPGTNTYNLSVEALHEFPTALRSQMFRKIVKDYFGQELFRIHCDTINDLIDSWNGQKALDLPGVTVERVKIQGAPVILFR